MSNQRPDQLIAHLFRHSWGTLIAILTRRFGMMHLELIEDSIQEGFVAALKTWPIRGVPDDPSAWLLTAARNRVIDSIRRGRSDRSATDAADLSGSSREPKSWFVDEVQDELLRMVLLCCDPEISEDSQVALTLQIVCGFSTHEIAAAYLSTPETISKRTYRAKQKLMASKVGDVEATKALLVSRLDPVLKVIYLLFNEGYSSHSGPQLVRYELCAESLRLVRILTANSNCGAPSAFALAALICFQSARLPGRVRDDRHLLLLEEQDRSSWDQSLISEGVDFLEKSRRGQTLSRYHLEAGIAACHALAPSLAETDWGTVVHYYDQLMEMFPSDIIRLNRAVAISMIDGCDAALTDLKGLQSPHLANYYLFHAALADLYRRNGEPEVAAGHYQDALRFVMSEAERQFLMRRVRECRSMI